MFAQVNVELFEFFYHYASWGSFRLFTETCSSSYILPFSYRTYILSCFVVLGIEDLGWGQFYR
jgi:hypothetical protein